MSIECLPKFADPGRNANPVLFPATIIHAMYICKHFSCVICVCLRV